nr:solute carrier organic anion transporter family member 4C1-like [Ciona intestinalis]|eukprot:XP_026695031.1 solute carrier organic anion transporter family member 4C1-like [Ciona intestinalis]
MDTIPTSKEGEYSFLCWKPAFLKCCNNAKCFLFVYSLFSMVAGTMIGGITNTNISTLERRFGLSSSQSALVVVAYDAAFCVLTVFVTYFGATSNRPRIVGFGSAIFGLGALVYALPHFISPLYEFGDASLSNSCDPSSTTSSCATPSVDLNKFMFVLLVGQLLLGCGTTPLYTLGFTYIEDSVPKNSAPVYLGLANAAALFGPAIGFSCGGYILNSYYVDIVQLSNSTTLTSTDPRWVGAWWIGPMVIMIASWIIVLPLMGFPKQLPGTAKNRAERKSEVHSSTNDNHEPEELENSLKNFPTTVWKLLKNPVFCMLTVAGCSTGLTVSGSSSFMAKFIQNEFHKSAGTSAMLAGAILVPAAVAGHLAGGGLITRFKMETPAILKLCAVSSFLVACASPLLLLRCDNMPLAGTTVPYHYDGLTGGQVQSRNLNSSCNSLCNCQAEFYSPACDIGTGVTYFSPCHGGCILNERTTNFTQMYTNCSCIGENNTLTDGVCPTSCNKLAPFLGLAFVMVLLVFLSHTPAAVVTLRIVPPSMRSFAVGLEWLFMRALGTIPGPIMYGNFIDSTCIIWQRKSCGDVRGSCWVYDSAGMAITFMVLSIVGNLVSAAFYGFSLLVYKPPTTKKLPVLNGHTVDTNRVSDLPLVNGCAAQSNGRPSMSAHINHGFVHDDP